MFCCAAFVYSRRPAVAAVVVAAATTCVEAGARTSPHHIIKTLVDIVAAAVQSILNSYNLHITKHCLLAKELQMMWYKFDCLCIPPRLFGARREWTTAEYSCCRSLMNTTPRGKDVPGPRTKPWIKCIHVIWDTIEWHSGEVEPPHLLLIK